MPYKIQVGNIFIECDTPEEAMDLANRVHPKQKVQSVEKKEVKTEKIEKGFVNLRKAAKLTGMSSDKAVYQFIWKMKKAGITITIIKKGKARLLSQTDIRKIIEMKKEIRDSASKILSEKAINRNAAQHLHKWREGHAKK